jgi:RNA polymerase sigma-70 factor (ECF subfamily)
MSCVGQAAWSDAVTRMVEARSMDALVREHARLVFRVAFSVLRNRHDAEDAAQETFLHLMRQDLRRIEEPRLWLARVAWRLAVKRAKRRPEQPLDDGLQAAFEADGGPGPEHRLIEQDMQARLRTLIDSLPKELRDVVRLSTVEGTTSRDVAAVLGIPEGTVRTRSARARQMLREKLLGDMERVR